MKKIFLNMALALMAVLMLGACSAEEFSGADKSQIPTMEGVNVDWQVDEETNTVTASVSDLKGKYPLWYIYWNNAKGEKQSIYSTLPTFSKQFVGAGTYTISLRLGNRNGFSSDEVSKTVTFTKSQVDWSAVTSKLCGTPEKPKVWRIDRKAAGHLGCGPSGSAGTAWWSAAANDKKDFGVYDDRIIFTMGGETGGRYSYNPGEDGKMYVNKGTTIWGTGAAEDFDTDVQKNETSFSLESDFYTPEGANEEVQANYIVLGAQSYFPYISDDSQYNNGKYRIESITATKLELVFDVPGAIAWHFILTSTEDKPDDPDAPGAIVDWDYNSENNLWKPFMGIEPASFFYAPGWAQIDNPKFTYKDGLYTVELPAATSDQWQSQMAFETDLTASLSDTYNFYCVLNSSEDHPGVTVKLTETDEKDEAGATIKKHDDNFFFAERVKLTAGEDYVFKKEGVVLPKNDAHALSLVFDFGGNAANTEISVGKIYLEKVKK